MAKSKLWDKGYEIDGKIGHFVVGEEYLLDQRLVKYDCVASAAHAKMLGKIGILTKAETGKLVNELERIGFLAEAGKFRVSEEEEDCHTAIENRLVERLGDLGKKIHSGRSRNDQVIVALRLYYKDHVTRCIQLADLFVKNANGFAARYRGIKLPGYTPTRKAMPSSIRLWSGAFVESMRDNIRLLREAYELLDQSPLGTGAGYGSPIKLDREFTMKELGFSKVQQNPIYVQLSRGKFELFLLGVLSQVMLDLNRMSTELIMFSMPEFGYYELPLNFTTGSSMMPNKKNPDFLERIRANYHVVLAYQTQVAGLTGNLPTGYSFDLAFTKEPVMRGLDITEASLDVMSYALTKLKVNANNCKRGLTDDLYATQQAYELVKSGTPFRDAYKQISKDFVR